MVLTNIFKRGNQEAADNGVKRDPRKARRFFEHAQAVADAHNYDYAVECYISGLKHEPDNMDKHEALREVSKKRKVNGGKPAGMSERLKTGGSDELEKMLHAEKVLAMDPLNVALMRDLMKHAVAADQAHDDLNLAEVAYWAGTMLLESNVQGKNDKKLYIAAKDLFVEIEAFDKAVEACKRALAQDQDNSQLLADLKDLEAENAMQQGGYSGTTAEEGGFRNFVRDSEKQKALEQEDRSVKSESAADDIISRRRTEYEQDPQDMDRLQKLVEALLAKETSPAEKEATDLLHKAWEESGQYRYKMRIGDVHMKQFTRALRQLKAEIAKEPDNLDEVKQKLKEIQHKQLQFELKEYSERVKNYPTDMNLRFEQGKRLYQAGQVDEAIGAFQQAKSDPKQRAASHLFLGSCYSNKGWHEEAIETLRQGIEAHGSDDDRVAMDMRYLLMDALAQAAEKSNNVEEAREAQKVGSKILQTNINFRDIRERMEKIRALVQQLSE